MNFLLALAGLIDRANGWIGKSVSWAILIAVAVSVLNALSRKIFNLGSNAWLELQWYLFGAIFLLAAAHTLTQNGHVRVDVLSSRFNPQTRMMIEIIGTLLFLMPASILIMFYGWPMFWESWTTQEMSSNAGGLIRWPAKLLVPVGFSLLIAAGFSHLIKCFAFLTGHGPDPTRRQTAAADEEALAEELRLRLAKEATDTPNMAAGGKI